MNLTARTRTLAVAVAGVAALVLLLVAKYEGLQLFVAHRALWSLASLVAIVAAALLVARLVRASGLTVAAIAAPLLLVLFVDLIVAPLPYELEHQAETLPRPAGESAPPDVSTNARFESSHPVARVVFTYPAGRNVTQLALESLRDLAAAGWTTMPPTLPGGNLGPYAIIGARKDDFTLSCAVGDTKGTGPTFDCTLTV